MLRATRNAVFLRKTFTLTPPKVDMSFNLHTTAGVSYKGKSQLTRSRHTSRICSKPVPWYGDSWLAHGMNVCGPMLQEYCHVPRAMSPVSNALLPRTASHDALAGLQDI